MRYYRMGELRRAAALSHCKRRSYSTPIVPRFPFHLELMTRKPAKRARKSGASSSGDGETRAGSIGSCSSGLSRCLECAIERLREQTSETSELINQIVLPLERSLGDPSEGAAKFMIIGERGAGKASFIGSVLERLRAREQVPEFEQVSLNGLLHADSDLSVARAIASSLAAGDVENCWYSANVGDCNVQISESVAALKQKGKGLIFVVSDFDCFAPAGSSHSHLYRITNLLEDTKLRSAFLGMTTQQDVLDGLEKRLKSRFQPTEVALPGFVYGDSQFEDVLNLLKQRLTLEVSFLGNDTSDVTLEQPGAKCVDDFNRFVGSLLADSQFKSSLQRQLARECTIFSLAPALKDSLYVLLRRVDKRPDSAVRDAVREFRDVLGFPFEGTTDVLLGLSRLEMTLLVALKLRAERKGGERGPVLFREVFEEYSSLRTGGSDMLVSSSEGGEAILDIAVAEKAWSRLVEHSLVVQSKTGPCASRGSWLGVHATDVMQALGKHPEMSSELQRWGKRMLS